VTKLETLHLELLRVDRDEGEGIAVVSRHPHSGHFLVAAVIGRDGALRIGQARLGDDLNGAISLALKTRMVNSARVAIALCTDLEDVAQILDALHYPVQSRDSAREALKAAIRKFRTDGLSAAIDPRAVNALRCVPMPSMTDLYFYSGDGDRPTKRRQAAESFPLLASEISSLLALKLAVDRAKPLMDALISSLGSAYNNGLSRATFRRLAQVKEPPYGTDIDTILKFASCISPDWIPSGGIEWLAFCTVAEGIVRKLGANAEEIPNLIKGCAGRWEEFCKRLVTASGGNANAAGSYDSVPRSFHDMRDMIQAFSDIVVMPLAAHSFVRSQAVVTPEVQHAADAVSRRMILGTRSATSLFEISRRWHNRQAAMIDAARQHEEDRRRDLLSDVPADGWPALTDPVQAPNGVWLVPLTSSRELVWEGSSEPDPNGVPGLDHCVASYATRCQNTDCHIVSLREIDEDGSYRRLSTVEIGRLAVDSDELSVIQHRAKENYDPSSRATDALNWYLSAVKFGEVELHREKIDAYKHSESNWTDAVERSCGFNWRDRDTLNAVVAPWGPFVDPSYRGYRLDDLLACEEIDSVRAAFTPEMIMARL